MRLLKRKPSAEDGAISGKARLVDSESDFDSVRSGEVAVLNLNGVSQSQAERLIAAEVAAVLWIPDMSEAPFPSSAPLALVEAGLVVLSNCGSELWDTLSGGEALRIDGEDILKGDKTIGSGQIQTAETVEADTRRSSAALANRLDSIAANAADRLRRERDMFFEGARIPELDTEIPGRAVVVIADGPQAPDDLKLLTRFIRESAPVIIAVGGGAEVAKKAGLKVNILVGEAAELSRAAIVRTREIVVIAPNGVLEDADRFEDEKSHLHVFNATGASQDLAILIADTAGADVIVVAGAPHSLTDLLEGDIADVSSAFVTRLRSGDKLVEASAVHHFTTGRIGWFWPVLLLVAGILAVVVSIAASPGGSDFVAGIISTTTDGWNWIKGFFS